MTKTSIKLQSVRFRFVADAEYESTIRQLAAKARRWFLASVFLVDTHSSDQNEPVVVHLVQALADAVRRGVFVRVIIGGSDDNFSLSNAAFGARGLFRSLGVPCVIASTKGRSSHKKLVIADDFILLGSHNWSEGAWSGQQQDSILIEDAGCAALMAEIVRGDWQALDELEGD